MAKAARMPSNYARYIHTQTRKVVTTAAGVQSIIESPVGAYKVDELNRWRFFTDGIEGNYQHLDEDNKYTFEIKDERLLKRLRATGIFQNLQRLIQVPPNVQDDKNRLFPARKVQTGRAEYFPTWFFCESCQRFKPLTAWWSGWRTTRHDIQDEQKLKSQFFYDPNHTDRPNCYRCYEDGKAKNRRKYHKLEQVRFVFVAPNGDIQDIDWTRWITSYRADGIENDVQAGKIQLGRDLCCANPSLKYIRSNKLSDLGGILIECESCKRIKSLSGFFNLRMKRGSVPYKPLIRTSNSIYYPISMSSLYIPQADSALKPDQEIAVRALSTAGQTVESISTLLTLPRQAVEQLLNGAKELTETDYRRGEYRYLTNGSQQETSDHLILAEAAVSDDLKTKGFERLIQVKRLKLTTVQTGYTRLAPMDKDIFSTDRESKTVAFDGEDVPLRARFTVTNPVNTDFLMGVENFGEGIFLQWNDTWLRDAVANYLRTPRTAERIAFLFHRFRNNEMMRNEKFGDESHLAKHMFIHSFSHLIIKELEFLCGYPSSSVAERIYCDGDSMSGLLIYTIAGSEGSFGGLIKQAELFGKLLDSALFRAQDCPSDPICSDSEGQGVGGLNYAACFSCLLISETSCEEFNSFLDRRIILELMR